MPAPSLEALFNIEPPVELAWKTLLARYDIKGFTQRESADLPRNRVDIQLRLGAQTGHRHPYKGSAFLDAWNYQLILGITTDRLAIDPSMKAAAEANPADPGDTHNVLRARLRLLAQYATGALDVTVLPYHVFTSIQEAGTAPSVETLDDCDVSELTFGGVLSIRSNAWP